MGYRKPKSSKRKNPTLACDEWCACNCAMKCPYTRCPYTCLGGHASSPNEHSCVEFHHWTAEFVAVSRYERRR